MLGLLLAAVGGCAAPAPPAERTMTRVSWESPSEPAQIAATRPAPAPVVVQQSDDAALRRTVEEELGVEVVEELPEIKREPPKPRDPGADALVKEVVAGVGDRVRGDDGMTRVCISKIRNLSRASASEYEQFLERFAEVLSRSGRDDDLAFLSKRTDEDAQYDMVGSAYLITAEGFDLWELFITITPADEGWTVWRPAGPVRVLRQERPGQQQVFPSR